MFTLSRMRRVLATVLIATLPLSAAQAVPGSPPGIDQDEVGARISLALNERDAAALVAMIDTLTLGKRVAAKLFEDGKSRTEFALGFARSATSSEVVTARAPAPIASSLACSSPRCASSVSA